MIVKERDPKTLGSFLLKNGFSRQAISRARHHGGFVFVNHHRRYNNFKLRLGDEVIFIPAKEKKNKWLQSSNGKLDIIYETENYLVVNKPAGVLSIPSRYEDRDALVNRIMGYFANQGNQTSKPHIVTRLDRNTSGLVLIGKNAISHARFSKMGKDSFIKKYHAIVHGNFSNNELTGLVDKPIGKVNSGVKRVIKADGQASRTVFKVLKQKDDFSFVQLRLLTGRTHQIRVHMAAIGHPLVGDQMYGGKNIFIQRQALNCYYLEFSDPFTDQRIKLQIKDPNDMVNCWQRL